MNTKNSIFSSDVVYIGTRVVSADTYKKEFPLRYSKRIMLSASSKKYFLLPDLCYGISALFNAVYVLDIEIAVANYIISFENDSGMAGLFHPPIRIENTLLFAPLNSNCFAKYNLIKKNWTYFKIPKCYYNGEKEYIKTWIVLGEDIIFLPRQAHVLIYYNLVRKEFTYCDFIWCNNDRIESFDISLLTEYYDSVMIFQTNNGKACLVDTKTNTIIKEYQVDYERIGFKSVVRIPNTNDYILLKQQGGDMRKRIIRWNVDTDKCEIYKNIQLNSKYNILEDPFGRLYVEDDDIFLIPSSECCVYKLNHEKCSLDRIEIQSEIDLFDRENEYYKGWGTGLPFVVIANDLRKSMPVIFLPYDYSIAELDLNSGRLLNKRKWNVIGIERMVRQRLYGNDKNVLYEADWYGLSDLIKDIV